MKGGYFLLISVIAFMGSLFTTSFNLGNGSSYIGLMVLLLGWMGLGGEDGLVYISWCANPNLIISWILMLVVISVKKDKVLVSYFSLFFSLLSLVLSFSFLFQNPVEVYINEAGHKSEITELAVGYYFWLISILVMVVGNIYVIYKNYRTQNPAK